MNMDVIQDVTLRDARGRYSVRKFYTTAPRSYDYASCTVTVDSVIARGREWRCVEIIRDGRNSGFADTQVDRYASGLHPAVDVRDPKALAAQGLPPARASLGDAWAEAIYRVQSAFRHRLPMVKPKRSKLWTIEHARHSRESVRLAIRVLRLVSESIERRAGDAS